MTNIVKKDGKGLGILAAFAIVWHILGLFALGLERFASAESLANNYTNEQITYLSSTSVWIVVTNLIAVVLGLAGSITLLRRRSIAYYFFALSLLAVLIVMLDTYLRGGYAIMGTTGTGTSIAITLIAIFLFWATHSAREKGQLH